MTKLRAIVPAILLVIGLAAKADAGPIVVYGDSLSDNGNLFALTAGVAPASPPYFFGRFSNGPVAVEYLASALGSPLIDFAVGGATTGIGLNGDPGGTVTTVGVNGLPGLQTEFAATQASLGPYLGGLFVVWAGANDFSAPSPLDSTPAQIIGRGVTNIVGVVTALQGLGVQQILVPGLPDLGLTPNLQPIAATATAFTDAFNLALRSSLPAGVIYFDTAALFRSIVTTPALYGLTNVTDPCLVGITPCGNPNQYLFWDGTHPTTAGHAIIANAFEQAVVPEPSTLLLALTGLSFRYAVHKRRQPRR